ncbi:uncharacterized protein F5Z01DRAFT_669332 [Emericellopsis atlantica]|uniref:Secreted protein n=1 Tax=Emericellopsis atlantica TaxID=2614577 RepID=A0A9P8CJI7_9HYPO|nr:uncharacterized protein F5Z01DRAFT_669332 [Emericellopsis atlantica]KAG9249388.1 hypothetical protein F5Z01DRAFT_669332 [Emericellopsis atlantica]
MQRLLRTYLVAILATFGGASDPFSKSCFDCKTHELVAMWHCLEMNTHLCQRDSECKFMLFKDCSEFLSPSSRFCRCNLTCSHVAMLENGRSGE